MEGAAPSAPGPGDDGASPSTRPPSSIALWFRYGPAEHTELFHAMPDIVEALARRFTVHYFGLRSDKPIPERIRRNAIVHALPFRVDRTSQRDKAVKTALWLLALPFIGLYCRLKGIRAVYIDETVPLTAWLARMFYGPRVAQTVADFFIDVYFQGHGLKDRLARAIRDFDVRSWKKLPLIFTRVSYTRTYLAGQGFDPARIEPVYDPCDLAIYRPIDRDPPRARYGYRPADFVLVHHGILHPNKGNDRIIRALAELRADHPHLRYLLIGDGPDMPRLRALVEQLGVGDMVRFTGWLKTLPEVNEALNAGDAGLVMRIGQQADHFHVTGALVHAMACALPVVAARLGGIAEVAREDLEGLLFDPENMDEFKGKLLRLVRDATLRRRLGAAALERARELFDMRRVTERTVGPLTELAEGRRP